VFVCVLGEGVLQLGRCYVDSMMSVLGCVSALPSVKNVKKRCFSSERAKEMRAGVCP
jgi:hypothetical protein